MNKILQLWRVATHPRELRMALSGLGVRLAGDVAFGGLTDDETAALVRWTKEQGADAFVEIGTLFGLTARTVARETGRKVVAVDNFCWNPFGLTPAQHEAFTRKILAGSGVELVRGDAEPFLASLSGRMDPSRALVFLDGSHAYADVKREIESCKRQGVGIVAGHDFGNPGFGVTRAVRETFGEPDEVVGMCWIKRAV
ncbi:MAG: class I SAM-dependent methyltransferase [Kiritimatiellae bacterium]|nr:class I SAM-dependent methyltransferase [Kiritimatiellia bacterium]